MTMFLNKQKYLLKLQKFMRCSHNNIHDKQLLEAVLKLNCIFSYSTDKEALKKKTKYDEVNQNAVEDFTEDSAAQNNDAVDPVRNFKEVEGISSPLRGVKTGAARFTDRKVCDDIDEFVIRNIMSFPLHVEENETYDLSEEVSYAKDYSYPSVSSILNETMSEESRKMLEKWKQKMISESGLEKFQALCNANLTRGKKLHSAIKQYLQGADINAITVDTDVEGCWNSIKHVLPEISDVTALESNLVHPHLRYKGIVDCVASYKKVPYVIEWKQSENVKKNISSTFDAPVQVCAYMGALPWSRHLTLTQPVTNGLVVVAHKDGTPANVFPMDQEFCQSCWKKWLRRVQRYWINRSPSLQNDAL